MRPRENISNYFARFYDVKTIFASFRSSSATSLGSIPSSDAIFSFTQFHLKSSVDFSPNFAHDTVFSTCQKEMCQF